MTQKKIDDFHEIIIGLVAGVGADNNKIINTLKNKISSIKYQIKVIKLQRYLEYLSKKYNPIQTDDEISRIDDRITKCHSFRNAVIGKGGRQFNYFSRLVCSGLSDRSDSPG